jgi:hypothetical protein
MNPSSQMLSSKRAQFGLGGMFLIFAVSIPWFGIPVETQEELRKLFAVITTSYIAGQTVTDVASRGRTSGSHVEAPKS